MTACVTSFTWVFVFLAFLAVGRQLAFLADLSSAHVVAVASLVATLGVARSPASAIAVMREMGAAGPFCSQVMAVTVVKDVLVIVLFAVNLELIALSGLRFHHTRPPPPPTPPPRPAPDAPSSSRVLVAFARPALVVASSFAVGAVSGVLMSQLLRPPRSRPALSRVLRPRHVLALSGCLFVAGRRVGLEPLLLCVVAGATAANRRYATAESERETLSAVVGALMPGVNLAFFTLAGASCTCRACGGRRSRRGRWSGRGSSRCITRRGRVRPRRAGGTQGGGVDGVRHAGGGGVGAGARRRAEVPGVGGDSERSRWRWWC